VKLSLVPQEREYFRLFSEFAATLDHAAQLLAALMNDFSTLKNTARELVELEHVGDKIVHDIVRRLNKTFITPIDREDIYDLASTLDDVLDSIEATADLMLLYRIEQPTTHVVEQAAVLAKQTAVVRTAIGGLEKRKGLDDHWIEINRLENDGDRLYRDAVAELFDGGMETTDIIKWKDIYTTLEGAMDQCEDVANILESIVLKNT
jgi:predicted phosphate transport protein (TIGR00153 family)